MFCTFSFDLYFVCLLTFKPVLVYENIPVSTPLGSPCYLHAVSMRGAVAAEATPGPRPPPHAEGRRQRRLAVHRKPCGRHQRERRAAVIASLPPADGRRRGSTRMKRALLARVWEKPRGPPVFASLPVRDLAGCPGELSWRTMGSRRMMMMMMMMIIIIIIQHLVLSLSFLYLLEKHTTLQPNRTEITV